MGTKGNHCRIPFPRMSRALLAFPCLPVAIRSYHSFRHKLQVCRIFPGCLGVNQRFPRLPNQFSQPNVLLDQVVNFRLHFSEFFVKIGDIGGIWHLIFRFSGYRIQTTSPCANELLIVWLQHGCIIENYVTE